MNYLELLHSLPNELKSEVRKLENAKTKIVNNLWSRTFNEICLKENMMPNYTNLKYIYSNSFDPSKTRMRILFPMF